jgi:superfamily II DNA or RNA helicase
MDHLLLETHTMTNDKNSASQSIDRIERRLREIEEEKRSLSKELDDLKKIFNESPPAKDKFQIRLSPDEKITLFMKLFCCRTDVYPRLWENTRKGTKGYSPVCRNEWISGICSKPKVKCTECVNRAFSVFSKDVVKAHLEGRIVSGMYAIRSDDTCTFLAADFDGDGWQEEVSAYRKSAAEIDIPVSVEISRSGNGAHAWIFFSDPVLAADARRLGFIILSLSQKTRNSFDVSSYDRFFPNQDILPEGGFGNLIALPLQKNARNYGRTVFIDESLAEYEDQWEYLKTVKRITSDAVYEKCETLKQYSIDFESSTSEIVLKESLSNDDVFTQARTLEVIINTGVNIDLKMISPRIANELFRLATFSNPKFFELQNMRFSTWGTPRYICSARQEGNYINLPRGILEATIEVLRSAGIVPDIHDNRPEFSPLSVQFQGDLFENQKEAVQAMLRYEYGVLKAPPGAGKTVMGCAIIAERKAPTLIIVHRDQLVGQWQEQLITLLGIDKKQIGVYGGTRRKLKGMIDIAMIQSLARCENIKAMLSGYGHIIIDECHHIPAVTFENILMEVNAKYILGLSATPFRKDGLQKILFLQCGPIRYSMEDCNRNNTSRKVLVRDYESANLPINSRALQLYEIWDMIVTDPSRLTMIAKDVSIALMNGRVPVLLSDRKEHLSRMYDEIVAQGSIDKERLFILTGDIGKKERREMLKSIKEMINTGVKPCILSTGSFIGEGFDLPECDTLFLAMPVSFKGRLIQFAGRLQRDHIDKTDVFIYDYVDTGLGLTMSMFKKRISAYREMKYEIVFPENGALDNIISKKKKR